MLNDFQAIEFAGHSRAAFAYALFRVGRRVVACRSEGYEWAGLAGAAAKAQGLTGFVLKIPS